MIFVRPINDSTPNVTNPFSTSHKGTDYGYPEGEPVYASESGQVVTAVGSELTNWINTGVLTTRDYGNYVKLRHDSHYTTLYSHLRPASLKVSVGQQVQKGQKIAEVGNTGNSTGPHLHWEVRYDEVVTNPSSLMDYAFNNYFTSSPPTAMDRRPYWFDLINSVIWSKPFEQINDQMVFDWTKNYGAERERSHKWSTLVEKVFGAGTDSNPKTVEEVIAKVQSGANGNSELLAKQLAECQAQLKVEKAKYYEKLQAINSLVDKYVNEA